MHSLHLQGAFPLLCFWPSVRICEILKASKPKRPENAFILCMYPTQPCNHQRWKHFGMELSAKIHLFSKIQQIRLLFFFGF